MTLPTTISDLYTVLGSIASKTKSKETSEAKTEQAENGQSRRHI